MAILVAMSIALTAACLVLLVAGAVPAQSRAVRVRLHDLGLDARPEQARARRNRRKDIDQVLEVLGTTLETRHPGRDRVAAQLSHAGYRARSATAVYLGLRLALGCGLAALGWIVGSMMSVELDVGFVRFFSGSAVVGALYGGAIGWFGPWLIVRGRARARIKELQLALPDALDLMVICVEAGLGLNQALVRVASEIHHVSPLMTQELGLVNYQIRAGTPRDEALTNLAERTGVPDMSSLVTMLIQADRFGTSIARSLRVHADNLRTQRRQRAEEAAAKTAIKMLFPLVLCVFPALFVVILGPAFIQITQTLAKMF